MISQIAPKLIIAHGISAFIHVVIFVILILEQIKATPDIKTLVIVSSLIEVYLILSIIVIVCIAKLEEKHPLFRKVYPLTHIFVTTFYQLLSQFLAEAKTAETMFTTYVTSGSAFVHLCFLFIELTQK